MPVAAKLLDCRRSAIAIGRAQFDYPQSQIRHQNFRDSGFAAAAEGFGAPLSSPYSKKAAGPMPGF
jgi:hypothetical protein